MRAATDLQISPDLRRLLDEALQRIIEVAQPQAVILFGSRAQGQPRRESDVDLLVIARTGNRHALASNLCLLWDDLREEMPALPTADLLVVTPRQFLDSLVVGFAPYEAARHGVVLYGEVPARGASVAS
ncbi:MAG: nucleotidyltransferase domain-containing protein [Armatimonadetes bacterium]|nr:nucleotidyltransferase domain-containing protein [Armatimonadota bacterium]